MEELVEIADLEGRSLSNVMAFMLETRLREIKATSQQCPSTNLANHPHPKK